MVRQDVYAQPHPVTAIDDCDFYHTLDLPGYGEVKGPWDLRAGVGRYLGGVPLAGKRVLDVGAASGFLSFTAERQGAEVVSYDLSPAQRCDAVPFAGTDLRTVFRSSRENLRRLNNGYWFCHRALGSRARVVHGTAYEIPAAIGPVDVGICGSILLHLRDPFLALQNVCRLVKDTLIVADMIPRRRWPLWMVARCLGSAATPIFGSRVRFLPDARGSRHGDGTWWEMPPQAIRQFLAVLGFGQSHVSYHAQRFRNSTRLMYTVVAQRTAPPECQATLLTYRVAAQRTAPPSLAERPESAAWTT